MATQAGVPTVSGDGNTPLPLWDGSFTYLGIGGGFLQQAGVPTVLGDGVTPMEQWAGQIRPYATYMRWQGIGHSYLFNALVYPFNQIPNNQSVDMFSVRGWTFDVPRQDTLIPQAPDSSTRFPSAS